MPGEHIKPMSTIPTRIDPADIQRQRERNWVDFHPEDFCHDCGNRNITSWYVDSDRFDLAMGTSGSAGIVCPQCFVTRWELATGLRAVWRLVPEDIHEAELQDEGGGHAG